MKVTQVDGSPADDIIAGQKYLVPTVFGIPVICPSHVDEGLEGQTGRHWHLDDRWGSLSRPKAWFKGDCVDKLPDKGPHHTLSCAIIKDEGQPVVMTELRAEQTHITATGEVFASVAYLYHKYGGKSSKDGKCVHHGTDLLKQDGCLTCPAHGMKYELDGSPKYEPPFYISVRYGGPDHKIRYSRQPLSFPTIKFEVSGDFDCFPLFSLEDSKERVIMKNHGGPALKINGVSTLTLHMKPWPLSEGCPSLVKTDPRKENSV